MLPSSLAVTTSKTKVHINQPRLAVKIQGKSWQCSQQHVESGMKAVAVMAQEAAAHRRVRKGDVEEQHSEQNLGARTKGMERAAPMP